MNFKTPNILINLCLLRGSPAELPYSTAFLGILIFIEGILTAISLNEYKVIPGGEIFIAVVLSIAILIGTIYFLLMQKKYQQRFHKTLTAWLGTNLIITLLLKLTFFITGSWLDLPPQAMILFLFSIWNITILAYILKQSLEIKMLRSVLITFGILCISSLPTQLTMFQYIDQIEQIEKMKQQSPKEE